MFAYLVDRPSSVHASSWPEAQKAVSAGLTGWVGIGGKTLFYRAGIERLARRDAYGAPVDCGGGVEFLPPKGACELGEFLRPERPQCIVVRLPVGAVRDTPMLIHVPVSQCQPRKILWGKGSLADEPAGEYYETCKRLVDISEEHGEAERAAEKAAEKAKRDGNRPDETDEAAALMQAVIAYQEALLSVVQLAIPLAYAVTDELMDWGQWLDESDLETIALAALGVDPKKASAATGETST